MRPDNSAGLAAPTPNRWIQLAVGLVCMTMIANLQYGWTLFVNPIDQKFQWGTAAIQVAFSIFVFVETWLVPIEGWFVDLYGPRWVVAIGGILVALAWVVDAIADSLFLLYLAAAISGVGAAGVYGTCVANALKWFPDRRGLCAGITAAGFGAGAALTVVPISWVIATWGYQSAFLWFGLGQGAIILLLSLQLAAPEPHQVPKPVVRLRQSVAAFTPAAMLRTPIFYLLYGMFVMVAASGLMVTAQLAPIAKDFQIAGLPVNFLFISSTVLTTALVVDNILNGLARPFFGWVSDHLGRENTMALVFAAGAVSYWSLANYGHDPIAFMISAGLIYFTWGEIYSLFPATCTDLYGGKYAATNSGLLYTAKGTAVWVVPLASVVEEMTGSWTMVLLIAAAMNVTVALTAILILKPMRSARLGRSAHEASARPAA
jgi:OFA family oxalate/formate antiporter-like MFS transporter